MTIQPEWRFEADYFTACNCDWGCPCNFNAPPTQGSCFGLTAWDIETGIFDGIDLDGSRFGVTYSFPGEVSEGNGTAVAYVDSRASEPVQGALETIATGEAGGGLFELFAQLAPTWHPTRYVPIDFDIEDARGSVRIGDVAGADSELLAYPDGKVIHPTFVLPHGIEFKEGLATNAKRWWSRDEDLLGSFEDKYAAVARVEFTQEGLVG